MFKLNHKTFFIRSFLTLLCTSLTLSSLQAEPKKKAKIVKIDSATLAKKNEAQRRTLQQDLGIRIGFPSQSTDQELQNLQLIISALSANRKLFLEGGSLNSVNFIAVREGDGQWADIYSVSKWKDGSIAIGINSKPSEVDSFLKNEAAKEIRLSRALAIVAADLSQEHPDSKFTIMDTQHSRSLSLQEFENAVSEFTKLQDLDLAGIYIWPAKVTFTNMTKAPLMGRADFKMPASLTAKKMAAALRENSELIKRADAFQADIEKESPLLKVYVVGGQYSAKEYAQNLARLEKAKAELTRAGSEGFRTITIGKRKKVEASGDSLKLPDNLDDDGLYAALQLSPAKTAQR